MAYAPAPKLVGHTHGAKPTIPIFPFKPLRPKLLMPENERKVLQCCWQRDRLWLCWKIEWHNSFFLPCGCLVDLEPTTGLEEVAKLGYVLD